jgi:hypothetical protein
VLLDGRPERTLVWITHGTVGLDLVDREVALEDPGLSRPRAARVAVTA